MKSGITCAFNKEFWLTAGLICDFLFKASFRLQQYLQERGDDTTKGKGGCSIEYLIVYLKLSIVSFFLANIY